MFGYPFSCVSLFPVVKSLYPLLVMEVNSLLRLVIGMGQNPPFPTVDIINSVFINSLIYVLVTDTVGEDVHQMLLRVQPGEGIVTPESAPQGKGTWVQWNRHAQLLVHLALRSGCPRC